MPHRHFPFPRKPFQVSPSNDASYLEGLGDFGTDLLFPAHQNPTTTCDEAPSPSILIRNSYHYLLFAFNDHGRSGPRDKPRPVAPPIKCPPPIRPPVRYLGPAKSWLSFSGGRERRVCSV